MVQGRKLGSSQADENQDRVSLARLPGLASKPLAQSTVTASVHSFQPRTYPESTSSIESKFSGLSVVTAISHRKLLT